MSIRPDLGAADLTEGDGSDGPTPLSLWFDEVRSAEPQEVLEALRGRAWDEDRYVVKNEIDRGGMGVIYRVWDAQLRRHLAMKVLREDLVERPDLLVRFLNEAQITGQLEHPGIVPIHDFGLDAERRFYFTMMLVRGRDFDAVVKDVAEQRGGWSLTRALGVMLRVSETMAFAHDRKVVHRDLKPANIMVGPFGETFVMDWGLARVLGGPPRDGATCADATVPHVWTDRGEARWARPDAAMVSSPGQVMGTPAYMAPEQARPAGELPGPHMDV